MGTVRVCPGSIQRFCYCKIDFDLSPLKTTKNCTNGTSLQWLENFKKFTPLCMKIVDPNKPLDCPSDYRLASYKTNSSRSVPYCTKYLKIQKEVPKHPPIKIGELSIKNIYLLSCKDREKFGFKCKKNN